MKRTKRTYKVKKFSFKTPRKSKRYTLKFNSRPVRRSKKVVARRIYPKKKRFTKRKPLYSRKRYSRR